MMENFRMLRRQLALLICPELALAQDQKVGPEPFERTAALGAGFSEEWPLIVGSIYADHIGRSLYTVAKRIGVHSRFFKRLVASKGCSINTYNAVMGWFDQNWPADLAWPVDVPRPSTRAGKRKGRAA